MVAWDSIGRSWASWLTMLLFVSAVWPVAMRAIWRWFKFVVEIIGAHVVQAYSRIGLVIDLDYG